MNPKSTLIKDAIKCLTSAVGFACTTDEVQTIIATNLNGLKELSDEHPTLKLGVSVVSKLVNNLAPGWFEKGFSGITYKNLKAALNSQHPNDLNHDLVKLIRLASVEALRLVEKMYLDNLKKSDNNEDPKKVGQVFDRLVAKLKFVCENENEKVNNHTLNEHEEWRTHFTDYIFQETGVDPTSQFALEIKQNLPFCLDLAIKEALKDSKNERAFKSYQIWVLESIVENSRSTEVGIGNIQKELKALKEVWQTQNQITGNGSALASQIEAEIEYLKKGYNQILDAIINFEMLIDKRLEKTEITIIKEVENAKDEIIRHVNNSKGRKVNPILSSLPFNEIFEGRTQELQEVEILLTTYKTLNVISIHGIGGVGKSTLAKQLFLKLYDNYDFNLFLTGKDNFAMTFYENTLITNLGLNDTVNAIPSEDSRRVEKIAQLIVNELLNLPGEKLMLLDNIPYNMGGLQPLLNRGWHIISTSRNLNYGFKHYELQQASPEDAKLIYAVYFGLKYESLNACELVLIQTIVKRLSFHILAIELVAKNAKYLGWNLEKTVEQLDKNGLNIARYADIQTTHSQEVIKNIFTYILQIFPLENLDAKEQHLLLLYSLIPATNINAEEWALMLGDYAETWQHFSRQLHQKGWLSADDGNGFLLHALLAEVLRIKNENKFFEEAQTMINRLNDGLNDEKWHNNFQESVLFARIGLVLIGNINKAEYKFGILSHNLGKFYIETGNLLLAMRAFTRMQEVFTLLLNSAPHDSDFKNGLAISYSKLGETHSSLGNLDKALEFFEERNKLGKELYALQPNNVSFKNGLAISYSKLGETHSSLGNLAKALEFYENDIELTKELCELQPNNVSFKNGLAISYSKLGETHSSLGNLAKALEFFEKDIELTKELYALQPNNVSYKYGLAISYSKLGETHSSLGNLAKALEFFEKDIELTKELYALQPNNVSFKNALAISYSKLGATHSSLGNLAKALEFFELETHLFEELYELQPNNVSFKNGLAISYSKLGETHSSLGNLAKALEFFEERNKLGKELYELQPNNVSFKNGLAISYEKLGETHGSLGNLAKALEFFEERNKLGKELYALQPNNVSFKNGLAISYEKLGETHSSLGNLAKALKFFEKDIELTKELYELQPNNVSFKNGLAISYEKLGATHSSLGNLAKALEFFEKDIELTKELYALQPNNVSFKNGLAVSFVKLGSFHEDKLEDTNTAINYYKQSELLWTELVSDFPKYPEFKSNLQWIKKKLASLK